MIDCVVWGRLSSTGLFVGDGCSQCQTHSVHCPANKCEIITSASTTKCDRAKFLDVQLLKSGDFFFYSFFLCVLGEFKHSFST